MSGSGFRVTEHAARRWIDRVHPGICQDDAMAEIASHGAAIRAAACFGSTCVKLGCGARLVLEGEAVVTVLAPGMRLPELMRPAAYAWTPEAAAAALQIGGWR